MLTIRFLRQGRRNRAFFRIVLTESSKSSKSGFIKALGWYDPKTKETSLKKEEILNWVKCGAKPSNQLAKLLSKEKITHKNIKYVPNKPRAKKVHPVRDRGGSATSDDSTKPSPTSQDSDLQRGPETPPNGVKEEKQTRPAAPQPQKEDTKKEEEIVAQEGQGQEKGEEEAIAQDKQNQEKEQEIKENKETPAESPDKVTEENKTVKGGESSMKREETKGTEASEDTSTKKESEEKIDKK